jgi:Tfp pilus assembly protein PilV
MELMADGFSAYYNSHARGNTFQAKRFTGVITAAYEVGDCAFSSRNQHGTHLQRLKAAIWGQMVSEDAADQGHIYSSATMLEMFEQALPILVAPDAP